MPGTRSPPTRVLSYRDLQPPTVLSGRGVWVSWGWGVNILRHSVGLGPSGLQLAHPSQSSLVECLTRPRAECLEAVTELRGRLMFMFIFLIKWSGYDNYNLALKDVNLGRFRGITLITYHN